MKPITLKIDKRFRDFLPKHTPEELATLDALILMEGCRDPVVVWAGKNIIVDGHTRYGICHRHEIPFRTIEREFEDADAVIEWMASNQLGRRNLTDKQRTYFLGKSYIVTKPEPGQAGDPEATAEAVAKRHGVSTKTVHRAADFAQQLDRAGENAPEFLRGVIDGEINPTNADVAAVADAPTKEKAKKIAAQVAAGEHVAPKKKRAKRETPEAEEPSKLTAPPEPRSVDGKGKEIVGKYADIFECRVDYAAAIRVANGLAKDVKDLAELPGSKTLHPADILARLKAVVQELTDRQPHCICTQCDGAAPKDCGGCGGLGWMDQFRYRIGKKK